MVGRIRRAAIATMLSATACASGVDARTRSALRTADATPSADPNDAATGAAEVKVTSGWQRLHALLAAGERALDSHDRAAALTALAEQLCAASPTPQPSPHGEALVCVLSPPMVLDRHPVSLEIGTYGMIGVVARDLEAAPASALADAARGQLRPSCVANWDEGVSDADNALSVFHACAADSGHVRAVGRRPRDVERDLWQVSVALLATD